MGQVIWPSCGSVCAAAAHVLGVCWGVGVGVPVTVVGIDWIGI